MKTWRRFTEIEDALLVELRAQGMPWGQIAARLKAATGTQGRRRADGTLKTRHDLLLSLSEDYEDVWDARLELAAQSRRQLA